MTRVKTASQLIRNKLFLGGLALAMMAASATGGEIRRYRGMDRGQGDFYSGKETSLDLFGSASLGKYTLESASNSRVRRDTRFGAGAGLNYFLTRQIGIGAEAYSENLTGAFVDSASASLIFRLPLGRGGLAPYAFGGGGRRFDIETWFAQAGAGLEYRYSGKVGIFLDARLVSPAETKYYGVGRLGLRIGY